MAVTDFTRQAQEILRDPSHFQWYTVTLLAIVMYVYAVEVERGRWDIVLAGVAFWLVDCFNEVANALILHFTDRAALWTVTGSTSYLIFIGLTVEISLMFAIAGVIYVKTLPQGRGWNRLWIGLAFSCVAVGVEVLLHEAGVFHWEYWWWNVPFVPLIVIFGYLTFFMAAAWVYDMRDRRRQVRTVAAMAAFDTTLILVFGPVLGWI